MADQRGIKAGRAFVELYTDDRKFVRGLKSAQWKLRQAGMAMQATGLKLMGIGAAFAAPLVAGVKAAKDAQETLNKFEQVFGTQARAAGEFADTIAREIGRSRYEVRDQMASIQAFLQGLEFDPEAAFKMSQQVERLALDFASLYNIADQDAIEKFQSGLAGMSRPLRQYGINLLDSAVEQEALSQGLAKSASELTEQQKVTARLSIIMRAMTDQGAVGDAARTAGSFANRLKALNGHLRDTAVEIGDAVLPVLTPLLGKVVDIVKAFGAWIKQNQDAVVTVMKVAASLTVAGAAMVAAGIALKTLSAGVALLTTAMSPWAVVIYGAVAALSALAGLSVWKVLSNAVEDVKALRDEMKGLEEWSAGSELRKEETKLEKLLKERGQIERMRHLGVAKWSRDRQMSAGYAPITPDELASQWTSVSAAVQKTQKRIDELREAMKKKPAEELSVPAPAPPQPDEGDESAKLERGLQYDIAKLRVEKMFPEGMQRELATLYVEYRQALEELRASGGGLAAESLLQEKYGLLADQIRAGAEQAQVSVAGTFNPMATWGMGATSPVERTAKATEEMAKLMRQASNGRGLVFA